ncbi:unnamed protein product [Ceratitis capitata]|uniref:carboxylesterase n=1 Tax=Ceratitis capitata TaxID=7213 RepID=A0A811VEP4_CERCA|nr:unnamed protein product [Ceratitis capitata]
MQGKALALIFLAYFTNNGLTLVEANLPKVCYNTSTCVLGRFMRGNENCSYEAFLGIPYAKPPIGELRFSNPEEAVLWQGTLPALYAKPDCIQKNYIQQYPTITGSEDCLYLNVYRPKKRTADKLPVLFYIHGGGFFSGSPNPLNLGPEYFMDTSEVIVVVPAYRLGPFGSELGTKMGSTIRFLLGGDADRVTIFGHSAGGTAVNFHLLSAASEDLFHNAFIMSGVATAQFARPLSDPQAQVVQLAKALGLRGADYMDSTDLVKILRGVNARMLLRAVDDLKLWNVHPLATFRPNIELDTWPGAFLTDYQTEFRVSNEPKPLIIGHMPSRGEGLVLALRLASNAKLRKEFNANFMKSLSIILDLSAESDTEEVMSNLVNTYMDGNYEVNAATLNGFLELLGDAYFAHPTYKTIEANLRSNTTSLRGLIKFGYRGRYSYSKLYTGSSKNFGPAHVDDSLFLFKNPVSFPAGYPKTSREAALVKRYVGLLVDFAKTGNAAAFDDMAECTYDAFTQGACEHLWIENGAEPFQTCDVWETDHFDLWDEIIGY